MNRSRPLLVIPGDDPVMISDSPRLETLRERVELRIYQDRPASLEDQVLRARGARLMINSRGFLRWPREALTQLPELEMISTCSIGVDSIDLAAAAELGMVVSNVPGRTAEVIAEHALALMLGAAKRLAYLTSELKAGRWTSVDNVLLRGKMLGIVGTGSIGRALIPLARALGMQVQAWTFHPDPQRATELGVKYVPLDQLLATSDVVSLHVKLTPESRHLLSATELASMKPGSLLVNTARGAVVDTAALIEVLRRGHLGGAAIDVFDQEPLPGDHPLLACEHVVLTPHCADQNPEGRDLLNSGAVENVLAFLEGRPQNVVT